MHHPIPVDPSSFDLLLFRLNLQEQQIQDLKQDIEDLETHIADSEMKRALQEKHQLIAGVSFLGSIIVMLAGVIWSYRNVIFRG